MTAIEVRYTLFWIGDTFTSVSKWLMPWRYLIGWKTYHKIANEYLQDLRPQAGPPGEQLL